MYIYVYICIHRAREREVLILCVAFWHFKLGILGFKMAPTALKPHKKKGDLNKILAHVRS